MKTSLLKAFLILLCVISCLANMALAGDFVQRVFTARDGLGNATINDISFDQYGFVWLATEQGLYRVSNTKVRRIDKVGFENRLDDDYIQSLIELEQDYLLISTYSKVYLYNIKLNQFTEFGSKTLFPDYQYGGLIAHGKASHSKWILLTSKGALLQYQQNNSALSVISQLPADVDKPWHDLLIVDNDKLIIGREDKLELRNHDGALLETLPWRESYGQFKRLYQDTQGRVWISSSEGLFSLNLDSLAISFVDNLPFYITQMAEDHQGSLWLASRSGLLKWHIETGRVTKYQKQLKQQANIEYIYDLEVDSSGVIWVGGSGDGLAVVVEPPEFVKETITSKKPYYLANEMIWAIYGDNDGLWLGTDEGLILVDRKQLYATTITLPELELNDSIFKVEPLDEYHLLISTTNGLYVYDKRIEQAMRFAEWTQGSESLEHKVVVNTYKDTLIEGRIWFVTSSGIYYWQPQMLDPEELLIKNEKQEQVSAYFNVIFRDDKGALWLGGEGAFGVLNEDGQLNQVTIPFDDLSNVPVISQIVQVGPGMLWLGSTQRGLFEFDLTEGKIEDLSKRWRVTCNAVFMIQDTPDYRVVGCTNTIIRQNKQTLKVEVFSEDDGLIGNELNEGAFFFNPSQGLYVGTPDGVMLLDVPSMSNKIKNDAITLESVSIFYDDKTEVSLLPEMLEVIKPGARMVSFQLTSSDYLDDTPISLQYRIRRVDNQSANYLLLQGQPQINFSGLRAGDYSLDILSQRNGVWRDSPVSYRFEVQQYWWESRWVKFGVVLVLMTLMFLLARYRAQQAATFKKINIALQGSEHSLRQSLKGSDSDLWEWSHDSDLLHLENRSGVLDSSLNEIICRVDELPIHPEDRDRVVAEWESVLRGDLPRFDVVYRFQRQDQTWGWLKVKGSPTQINADTGAVEQVSGIYSDISIQRSLEDEVNLLAQAFENTSEGVLILDEHEKIKVANLAAEKILGHEPDSLISANFYQLISPNINQEKEVKHLIGNESSWTGEREFITRDGQQCPVWLNVSLMSEDKGADGHYVVVFSDITERRQSEANLRRLANFDVLTGLPNRAHFSERLQESIVYSQRHNEKLALLFLDLDRFKYVNDSYGHGMGDALLVEASNRLLTCISSEHLLCRFGGDEFVILIKNADEIDKINHLAEDILKQAVRPFNLYGREFFISASIGISIFPDDANDAEGLIKNADLAMYHAKEEGRGNFQYYSSERNKEALYHLRLEADLRKAIERDELELHFQPQIDILNGDRLVGLEALLRWRHPTDGYVRPDIFIHVAETCGLILEIETWVLRQACRTGKYWLENYPGQLKISVNISAVHFRQTNFIAGLAAILRETDMPASSLTLEITEGVLMKELHVAREHLKQLQGLGVSVAIDDFGTGYSSLAYLSQFEVDSLKIDRSFLNKVTTNPVDQAIVSSVIELARNLKLEVVAEGVETEAQLEQVFSQGCYIIQGYYFAKPMPAKEISHSLATNKWKRIL